MCPEFSKSNEIPVLRSPRGDDGGNSQSSGQKPGSAYTVSATPEENRKRGPVPPDTIPTEPKAPTAYDIRALP